MTERLSDGEWKRIQQFARTPMHERSPDMLTPDAAGEDVDE